MARDFARFGEFRLSDAVPGLGVSSGSVGTDSDRLCTVVISRALVGRQCEIRREKSHKDVKGGVHPERWTTGMLGFPSPEENRDEGYEIY